MEGHCGESTEIEIESKMTLTPRSVRPVMTFTLTSSMDAVSKASFHTRYKMQDEQLISY